MGVGAGVFSNGVGEGVGVANGSVTGCFPTHPRKIDVRRISIIETVG